MGDLPGGTRAAVIHSSGRAPCASAIAADAGARPEIWITAAKAPPGKTVISWDTARARLEGEGAPVLILVGTAHGLHPLLTVRADAVLPPFEGHGYNHLSVRAAAAITLDRLRGTR